MDHKFKWVASKVGHMVALWSNRSHQTGNIFELWITYSHLICWFWHGPVIYQHAINNWVASDCRCYWQILRNAKKYKCIRRKSECAPWVKHCVLQKAPSVFFGSLLAELSPKPYVSIVCGIPHPHAHTTKACLPTEWVFFKPKRVSVPNKHLAFVKENSWFPNWMIGFLSKCKPFPTECMAF